MDRLLTLEVFTAVVEKGSFVAAARALDLSPASVTEHIQALERRLRTKLLNRTTRRIALTEEGGAYFEHCQQVLARIGEADAMLAAKRRSPAGTLRMQGPQVLVSGILLPRISKVLDKHPGLSVEMAVSASFPDLVQQNLDLAILINPDPHPGVTFRPIGLCPVVTFASRAYLRKHGTPKSPEDLERHSIIGVRTSPGVYLSRFRFQHEGRMISHDYAARITVDLGDGPAVAAMAGVGVGQSYSYAVAHHIEEGKLVPILQEWAWSGPPIGAVHLPNRFLSPKVQVFLDFVKESLGRNVSPYRADWDNR